MDKPIPDRGVYARDELDRDTEGHGFPPAPAGSAPTADDDAAASPRRDDGGQADDDDDVEGHISINR